MLGTVLRQINRLFASGTVAAFSDAELLERFVSGRDDAAFEALVARHGPMILNVCRGVLNNPNDAEDAFQATFLILVKKAGTFRGRVALGGWLYMVAHRVAIRANAAAARRRACERRVGQMAAATSKPGPEARDEQLRALHEEIAQLPEKFRVPIVLCDLQGLPQDRAAGELCLSERTLRRRLSGGRERLKARLIRRGLAQEGSLLAAVLLREARAAVPVAWREAAVRAASATVNHAMTAGAVSAAAQRLAQEVLGIMLLQNIKLVSAVILGVGLLACVGEVALIARDDEPQRQTPARSPAARREDSPAVPQHPPDPFDTVGTFPVSGRVLDPDGKLADGAAIYVHHRNAMRGDAGITVPPDQTGRVAETRADGRFRFQFDRASSNWPSGVQPAWHTAVIAAVAPGFGPAWVTAGSLAPSGEAALRLVRDDVPIDGRVLDLQGRPVQGATIRLLEFAAPLQEDLTPWIKAVEALRADGNDLSSFFSIWSEIEAAGLRTTRNTDSDGRFRLTGVGRERAIKVRIEGPAIETQDVYVLTRVRPKILLPVIGKGMAAKNIGAAYTFYGATFDHVAKPTRPIVGMVRARDTGRPLPGVKVESYRFADFPMDNFRIIQAVTDSEGKYHLDGLPDGPGNEIVVTPPADQPYLPALRQVDKGLGLNPVTTDIALKRGIWIEGRVTDKESGLPIKALVHYYARAENPYLDQARDFKGTDTWFRFRTSEDGSFRAVGLPGPGLVGAIALEYKRFQQAERVGQSTARTLLDVYPSPVITATYHALIEISPPPDAERVTSDLRLTPSGRLSGTVLDPSGKALFGVRVFGLDIGDSIIGRSGWRSLKESSTFIVTRLRPGQPRRLLFLHEGTGLAGILALQGDEKGPLIVRLQPAGTIAGRLVDADGQPRGGLQLIASLAQEGHSGFLRALPDPVQTDSEGRFRLAGLVPGLKYDAGVDGGREGLVEFAFKDVSVQAGQTRDLGDVTAEEAK